MTDWVIDVKDITKTYGQKTVVNKMDLKIKKGEVYGFLGPNGSGKTTMMRILCGLLKPDEGSGTCLGYDFISEYDKIKPHVGYMPQTFSYYKELSVSDNLAFIASLYGHEDVEAVVKKSCKRFGLEDYKDTLAGNLSGGWKQRLSLAAAMLNNPKFLLLDEPTVGVDPDARRYFWAEIHQIAHEGVTILVSTHLMDEAMRCDRLVYILSGYKIVEGSQDELIEKSGITVYEVFEDIVSVQHVMKHQFPQTMLSMLSGRLRIVVKPEEKALLNWISASDFIFEPVKPNIEEVFIYYSGVKDV